MLLEDGENYSVCVGQLIVEVELPLPLKPVDRSVPVTCAACDFYTNELGLSLWRARGSLIVFDQANTVYCEEKRTLEES